MDNKYGLGSAKVATAHHNLVHAANGVLMVCRHCSGSNLTLNLSLNDHYCEDCGQYQEDIPLDYSTGHSSDY